MTLDGVDLDKNRVLRAAFAHERRDGRIACVAPIPVRFPVDFDGLEQGRQTCRSEQYVRAELSVAKHAASPGPDIGRGDEEFDGCFRQELEIDRGRENLAQRIVPIGFRS